MGSGKLELHKELKKWRNENREVNFFLRDDDAIEVTPQLLQLAEFSESYGVPILLAIIPKLAKPAVAEYINNHDVFTPAVHGFAHINHAPADEKKQELGDHRAETIVLNELIQGRQILLEMFPDTLSNIFVPPWNRMANNVADQLVEMGFTALSGYSMKRVGKNIRNINTHIDIIDWKNGGFGKPTDQVFTEIAKALMLARTSCYKSPIGILSHHLVHDQQCWKCLDEVVEFFTDNANVNWISPDKYLNANQP